MTAHAERPLKQDAGPHRSLPLGGMSPRMRSGVYWTAAGLLVIGATVLLAAESLLDPGGWSLPAWGWPVPLVAGIAAIGFGFGVMAQESARQQQSDVEAHDAFAEIHQADNASDLETNNRRE